MSATLQIQEKSVSLILQATHMDVYVSGNYAYVADGYAGLRVIDVSNPSNPREVGYFDTPGYADGCLCFRELCLCGGWGMQV
jgi:hypothetical protein